jgi:hypothetical protein
MTCETGDARLECVAAAETYIYEQIGNEDRGFARGPERALMAALLFDGIQSYMNYICAESDATRARYREAYNWVHNNEGDYVFSFVNVCEGVGVDPEYLRFGLVNVCTSHLGLAKKMRKGF